MFQFNTKTTALQSLSLWCHEARVFIKLLFCTFWFPYFQRALFWGIKHVRFHRDRVQACSQYEHEDYFRRGKNKGFTTCLVDIPVSMHLSPENEIETWLIATEVNTLYHTIMQLLGSLFLCSFSFTLSFSLVVLRLWICLDLNRSPSLPYWDVIPSE